MNAQINKTGSGRKKRIIKNHYEPLLARYADGYRILDWESRESQFKRFEVLVNNVDLADKSLLDVGCGTGDLYGFLKDSGITANYTGVDILEEMTARAGESYPEGRFFTGDIFRKNMYGRKQFDVVFCSGIFNLNLGNNEEFFKKALPVLFWYAKHFVVFNLLGEGAEIHGEKYFYFNKKDVIHTVRKYSRTIRCITGYIPHDFTIIAEAEPDQKT